MTSRATQKARARSARLAQARAAAARQQRRRRQRLLAGLGVAAVAAVAIGIAVVSASSNATHAASPSVVSEAGPPWQPRYDNLAARLTALHFPPNGDESFHIHALLHVYVDTKPVTVPANIGITTGIESPLHTHDTSGIIHIEAGQPYAFTLGGFFQVWGVKFTNNQLGDRRNTSASSVQVFVDGKPVADPVGYVLRNHDNIAVGYGPPGSFPTTPPTDALQGL